MHRFPDIKGIPIPERFTDPFRYSPHPLVKTAAGLLISRIEASEELSEMFAEGKMMGVLVVLDRKGEAGYLAAFSGNVAGRSIVEGFVPPIYDLLDPSGYFKTKEAEITSINKAIASASDSPLLHSLRSGLAEAERDRDEEIGLIKARMAISKRERDEMRSEVSDPSALSRLVRESQFEKAELKRLKAGWEERIRSIREELGLMEEDIASMKRKRAALSDQLQNWIFSRYIVHNALGEEKSIGEIFAGEGLIPPGGTGECAAPKLLEYAFRNGLKPLAMGEFWYGRPSVSAVRTAGHFYPSCTSKCGPLLGFMLGGLELESDPYPVSGKPVIIFEDQWLTIASKPAGMPSVPGLDGRLSLTEWLSTEAGAPSFPVHRLDMDTSGIMVFAKDADTSAMLQKQFECHCVSKTYKARLSAAPEGRMLQNGDKGEICLPLSADYDERPRQKADSIQGKQSLTAYEVTAVRPDGCIDILFHPHTGRTHQLRVHSAHILGLGHPILGDLLYGGSCASRLHLHAASLSFDHPATGDRLTFTTSINGFDE